MRVLLDENLPHDLAALLTGHTVATVSGLGWAGITNGALLRKAEGHCDAFLTMDRRLPETQDISKLTFAVVLIRARSNRMLHLRELVPAILQGISAARAGTVTAVGA